jgi:hypothetical protein
MPQTEQEKKIAELEKELKAANEKFGRVQSAFSETSSKFNLNFSSLKNYTESILPGFAKINDAIKETRNNMDLGDAMGFLEIEATEIQNAFGVSKQRVGEFKQSIADLAPELIMFGLSQEDAAKIIIKLGDALGTTGVVGQEALREIGAASQITGLGFEDLAKNFREVGVSIYNVGDIMKEVTDYAKSVGVSVQAVSKGVVSNLDKMNIYNFENGINGLTKMAAQASRLGVEMSTVFNFAEKVFNPEGAIDMAAGLQRLGVAAGDLLDPLRTMDLAANDPAELQNQLVELTKTFTKFNEKTQQFEIMPGEKRRLREIAEQTGISIGELTKMSIKAAEFDEKMKKIQFPSFTADKETKELIAGMAQMKDGRAQIAVKDERGVELLKEINQLTPEDVDKLREQEEESSKTIEQLAIDQLDQLKMLNSQIAANAGKTVLGMITTNEQMRGERAAIALTRSLAVETNKNFGSKDVRKKVSEIEGDIEGGLIKSVTTNDIGALADAGVAAFEKLITLEEETFSNIEKVVGNAMNTALKDIMNIYKEQIKTTQPEKSKKEIDLNLNYNLKSDGTNINIAELENMLKTFFTSIDGIQTLKDAVGSEQLPQ